MKKTLFLVMLSLVTAGADVGPTLFAQQPDKPRQEQPKEAPPTRIAVVNVKVVFEKYERAIATQKKLHDIAKPYQAKAEKIRDTIRTLEAEFSKPSGPAFLARTKYEDAIHRSRRELDDLTSEFARVKRTHEDEQIFLWKEMNLAAHAVAKQHGFELVLPIGEPVFPEPTIERPIGDPSGWGLILHRHYSVRNIDYRAPLYVHGSIDITDRVVNTLNQWVREARSSEKKK